MLHSVNESKFFDSFACHPGGKRERWRRLMDINLCSHVRAPLFTAARIHLRFGRVFAAIGAFDAGLRLAGDAVVVEAVAASRLVGVGVGRRDGGAGVVAVAGGG